MWSTGPGRRPRQWPGDGAAALGGSPEARRGGQIVAMVLKAKLTEAPGSLRGFSRESGIPLKCLAQCLGIKSTQI